MLELGFFVFVFGCEKGNGEGVEADHSGFWVGCKEGKINTPLPPTETRSLLSSFTGAIVACGASLTGTGSGVATAVAIVGKVRRESQIAVTV